MVIKRVHIKSTYRMVAYRVKFDKINIILRNKTGAKITKFQVKSKPDILGMMQITKMTNRENKGR